MADDTNDDPGAWRQMSAGLYMQADVTDAGRLVRLADVVRWVVRKKEKDVNGRPLAEAVDWVCERLKDAPREPEFFDAHPVTWAFPVAPAGSLGYFTKERLADAVRDIESLIQDGAAGDRVVDLLTYAPSDVIAQANAAAGGVSRANAAEVLSLLANAEIVQPGPEAVALCMRRNWTHAGWQALFLGGEVTSASDLDDRNRRPWSLCVRVQDAKAIWGWGMAPGADAALPLTFEQVAAKRKKSKKAPWTADDWGTVCKEIQRLGGQGGDGVIKSVAEKLGMTVRGLNDLVKKRPIPSAPAGATNVVDIATKNDPFARAGRKASGT